MQVTEAGHGYELMNYSVGENGLLGFAPGSQPVIFVSRLAGDLVHEGTTNEEVLAMLIDRMKFLNGKFPCRENSIVITKLEEALMWLNRRTELRQAQGVEGQDKPHQS